jgi:hypothetical protein
MKAWDDANGLTALVAEIRLTTRPAPVTPVCNGWS